MFAGQKATCSVSAKKLSGFRSSTIRPTFKSGTSSSGMSLVGSNTSKSKRSASFSLKICKLNSQVGKSPLAIASCKSRR